MILGVSILSSQTRSVPRSELRLELSKIDNKLRSLKSENDELSRVVSTQKTEIKRLSDLLVQTQSEFKSLSETTSTSAAEISSESKNTKGQIQEIGQTVSTRTIWSVIIIAIFGILGAGGFVLFGRRLATHSNVIDARIKETRSEVSNLIAGANRRDAELADILRNQLSLIRENEPRTIAQPQEFDHKLAIRVGDEIHRMRKRIDHMPAETKGLGALRNSLTRLEEEFNDRGYEIMDLIGKDYVDGLKVEARFVDDPSVPPGKEIITDVILPQIMFGGVVIRIAKVEVGKCY